MYYQRQFLFFRKYTGIFPPNIMETITDLCNLNADTRSSEQNVKPVLQSTAEISVIMDCHTALRSANRSFRKFIILKKIHFEIHLTKHKVAYIEDSRFVWKAIYFHGQGTLLDHWSKLCYKLIVTKDLIVLKCTAECCG